ncbi:uncharacterized protein LOC131693378 isoform X4 [Topomyia yanbarensis]|uniref:uncharacterized protein LOC131693378 isoform X4 n=1 Tax=Topomyia yanbarensis TaxID=2498891 RepID=UPI00273CA2F7|nr:uncharacterized protein LOC131693378 isoform X4 [Topomyia yanbarensis]
MVDNFDCAGYTFYSKFDSGNLGRVELVRCCEGLNIIGNNVSSTNLPASSGTVAPEPLSSAAAPPTILSSGSLVLTGAYSPPAQLAVSTAAAAAPLSPSPQQPTATVSPSIVALANTATSSITSATVASTELLHHHQLLYQSHYHAAFVEVEFNLWTRPDCAGTPYENQNRTWFYFAVRGGRPHQIVKFNVMNLNKQAKLFSQGMHPVMKVGSAGRWERIKDKPSYAVTNDIFFISFLHRAPESPETKTYYAFTFPFTYNELLEQLGNFDKRFGRHPFELHQIAHEIAQKYDSTTAAGPVEVIAPTGQHSLPAKKGKLSKGTKLVRCRPDAFDDTARDGSVADDAVLPKVNDPGGTGVSSGSTFVGGLEQASSMSIDDNTSESMQQITNLVKGVKIELKPQQPSKTKFPTFQQILHAPTLDDEAKATNLDVRDDIYYYRELLTHSVERRRVELLTISSFHGIQTAREQRLRNLFPDEKTPRCHTFKNKKIIFISSRVHPGETPASFVLNGFLSMLLDRKSIVSITLRRMYVFKIIPFLNPDGVYNGLYRSDTRGHNLNRVYLAPNVETQPAIYAARKLIRYYHLGTDEPELYELESEKKTIPLVKSSDTSSEEVLNVQPMDENIEPTIESTAPSKECSPSKKGTVTRKKPQMTQTDKTKHKMPRLPKLTPPIVPSSIGVAGGTRKTRMSLFKNDQSLSSIKPTNNSTSWPAKLLNKVFRRRKATDIVHNKLPLIAHRKTPTSLAPVIEEPIDFAQTQAAKSGRSTLMLLSQTSSLIVEISQSMEKNCVDDSESTEENTASTSDSGFGEQTPSGTTGSESSSTVTVVETEISSVPKITAVSPLTPAVCSATDSLSTVSTRATTAETTTDVVPSSEAGAVTTIDEVLPPPTVFTEQLIPELLPLVTESSLVLRPVRSISNLSTGSSMVNSASTIAPIGTKRTPLTTAKVDSGRKVSSFKSVIKATHMITPAPNTLKMKEFGTSHASQQHQQNQSASGRAFVGAIGTKKTPMLHHKRAESKTRPQTPQIYSHFRSHRNEYLNAAGQKNINISLDYLAQLDEKIDKVFHEEKSNMFLYIDLHGHASKKGVFMYGNHLPNTIEAVECMLLPRLMSLNSQHFHYDACNFSERNMYYKGKRDGLSKEGSGRVAIYKCTGLIKSYTLECNYNTGKSVNILPMRGKETPSSKVQSPVPPKYTPAVFEEVGRALGPSILDLTNSNPQSRLPNSEFRTLQGLRNTLRIEIERGSSKARVTNKFGDVINYPWVE